MPTLFLYPLLLSASTYSSWSRQIMKSPSGSPVALYSCSVYRHPRVVIGEGRGNFVSCSFPSRFNNISSFPISHAISSLLTGDIQIKSVQHCRFWYANPQLTSQQRDRMLIFGSPIASRPYATMATDVKTYKLNHSM